MNDGENEETVCEEEQGGSHRKGGRVHVDISAARGRNPAKM
jgi:hypothetical protein